MKQEWIKFILVSFYCLATTKTKYSENTNRLFSIKNENEVIIQDLYFLACCTVDLLRGIN